MDVIDKLVSIEEQIAGLHAQQLRLIASLRDRIADFKGFARDEVAVALRWSDGVARERFHIAAETTEYFPELLDALDAGQVTFGHVSSFCELTAHLDEDTAALLMENVLDYAQSHSIADFRRKVKRELVKADPVVAEYTYEQALEDRRVWSAPAEPGMATMGAVLPAEGAATLMSALTFLTSQPQPGDTRSKDQRMADALVQLARDALAGGCSHCNLPARVVGSSVNITIALSTLLDLDDQPGELDGEAIPAELARALAHDQTGTWRRLITDQLGHLDGIAAQTPPRRRRVDRPGRPHLPRRTQHLPTRPDHNINCQFNRQSRSGRRRTPGCRAGARRGATLLASFSLRLSQCDHRESDRGADQARSRRMHARGHRSRPCAASRSRIARSPGVHSLSSSTRNPHRW